MGATMESTQSPIDGSSITDASTANGGGSSTSSTQTGKAPVENAKVETMTPEPKSELMQLCDDLPRLEAIEAKYKRKHDDLLAEEQRERWDWKALREAAGDEQKRLTEQRAGEIIHRIRENERMDDKLYGNVPGEAVPKPETRDMGGRFLVNKDRIERSRLFELCKQMPKGAHLHLHFNAELPPEIVLGYARDPKMHNTFVIRSTIPLITKEDFKNAEIIFGVEPAGSGGNDIFSRDYKPRVENKVWYDAWMLWTTFQKKFPQEIETEQEPDGKYLTNRAECWVRDKTAITVEEAYNDRQTTNGAWACFNQGTRAFKGLINYESGYRRYVGDMIESLINDKIMYAELRPMLLDKFIPTDDGLGKISMMAQMEIICEEVRKVQARRGKEKFPFGVKLICCAPRSVPRFVMKGELDLCLKLKLKYPDLICGFDLVGAEDRPNHIGHYADLLIAFTQSCRKLGVEIPFMFHAGETLIDTGGSHNPDNSNLYDSWLLEAKRIGHGYALLRHPGLTKKFVNKKICLELCPISNELLHLCGNARQHIFSELLAAGLRCTLNADNPSLFR